MQAVVGELVVRNIPSHIARCGRVDEKRTDHVAELMLRLCHLMILMEERRKLGVVVTMELVDDERVGLEHRAKSLARTTGFVPDLAEMREVPADLTLVPAAEDRFDVGEVFVERRASDARLLGDLRHRDTEQSVLGDQGRGGIHDRVAHLAAVRLDRPGPELRHNCSIRDKLIRHDTHCLVNYGSMGNPIDTPNEDASRATPTGGSTPGMPRWVKVSLLVAAVLIALFVVLKIAGVDHGPGRHMGPGRDGGEMPVGEMGHTLPPRMDHGP